MNYYKNILCAIDLDANSVKIIQTALAVTGNDPAIIHVVHTCEHPITGYGELTGSNHQITETQIRQKTYPELCAVLEKVNIPKGQGHIIFGPPAEGVHKLAKELNCDLIVVGSHGKSGLRLLFGSTSNSVLHGAQCDVLTVRIED
ncbi:universal stress protein [Aestuariicella hydrocarbonica]|uniref:Universal stress protein n=1 Tax=Pseudomaricurvus hydrocarbonicus TaxID=1470433 RepID=A0A9E5JZF0_9GAMM|nr:universal stress protein [Aestuariicella hydrocarbonica]